MYEDSVDQATPSLYIPKSTAGKFINAVIGEDLDNFDREIDLFRINSFIERADVNQLSWLYSSTNVTNVFNKVLSNGLIELARIDNLVDFYKSKPTDDVFYHNPLNREILTIKQYGDLSIKSENTGISTTLSQTPILKYNWFDEMGARVGLFRLHLESNASYKERILDVFKNPNGADIESFKKVLRRELNLWKAFGVEPSSSYVGATPEVMEISDLEYSTPYFTADGNPTDLFKKLVEDLNVRYPTNWGYFRFGDSIWDYAGEDNEGVNRIRSRYYDDEVAIPYYQPGVGDLSDAGLFVTNYDATPQFFETSIVARGKVNASTSIKYEPVKLEYEYYGSYEVTEYDNPAATVNLTLEFSATPHGSYATPITFFAPITYYPKNNFSPTHSAYPEYNAVEIFDTEGYISSKYSLKEKQTLSGYRNTRSSINTSRLEISKIENIVLKNGLWNGSTYATPNSDNFEAKFSHRTANLTSSGTLLSATPNFAQSTQLQILSKLYNPVQKTKYTTPQKSEIIINDVATPPADYIIDHDRIISNIIMPVGATPKQIFINNLKPTDADLDYLDDGSAFSGYGGVSYYLETDRQVYVPSSPNITLEFNSSNLATPSSNSQVGATTVNGSAATASYYFTQLQYPYTSTPNSLKISTQDGSIYPFEIVNWDPFELTHASPISGYVDEYGVISYNVLNGEYVPGKNSNYISIPELTREGFGLSGSEKFEYFFETIEVLDPESVNVSVWSEQKIVNPFLNRTYVLNADSISSIYQDINYTTKSLNYPDNSISESYDLERNTTVFNNFIVRGKLYDAKLDARINTGWIHLDNNEYYVYAKPVTETQTGVLKEITLNNTPRQGAPVIVNVSLVGSATPELYTEVGFPDESSPRHFGFYNTEVLQPRFDNSFYLGYKNVYSLSITDGYTGELLFSDLSTNDSFIKLNKSVYEFKKDRDYYIKYKVLNSYYIDNVVDESSYYPKIVFDATPNATMNYEIIYESSIYENSTPVDLNFGQTSSLLEKGYVIASSATYNFDRIKVVVSPGYILDDGNDYVTISIISLDSEGNPKPYQSFYLYSTEHNLDFDNNIVTTDDEGFVSTNAVYVSGDINRNNRALISIVGRNHASNSLAHPDSETEGFRYDEWISIYSSKIENSKLLASANPSIINADGVSSTTISGILTTNNAPSKNSAVYWRKARNLYSVLNDVSYSDSTTAPDKNSVSGVVYTDDNGKFEVGPIPSQERATPGYWFMSLEKINQYTRTNLAPNPNFETNVTGWTAVGISGNTTIARSTADKKIGTAALLVSISDDKSGLARTTFPVTPGKTYTVSVYAKLAYGTSNWFYMSLVGYDSGGTPGQIEQSYTVIDGDITLTPLTTSWERTSFTFTALPSITSVAINLIDEDVNNTTARAFYVDAFLFEESEIVLPYFDGTYHDSWSGYELLSNSWSGTANNSSSTAVFSGSEFGDITYWYESYDNVDINFVPGLKIPDIINYDINKSLDIYSTPTFRISYYNENIVENTESTPRWTPPQWLPIPRYEQYQAGYFGATPYVVSDYSNLIKDYED